MSQGEGTFIFHAIENLLEQNIPPTAEQIVFQVAIIRQVQIGEVVEPVKKCLQIGVEYGYIEIENGIYRIPFLDASELGEAKRQEIAALMRKFNESRDQLENGGIQSDNDTSDTSSDTENVQKAEKSLSKRSTDDNNANDECNRDRLQRKRSSLTRSRSRSRSGSRSSKQA